MIMMVTVGFIPALYGRPSGRSIEQFAVEEDGTPAEVI
jgi:hypothetical protein